MHYVSEKCRMKYLIAKFDAGLCDIEASDQAAMAFFGGVRVYMNEHEGALSTEEHKELYDEVMRLETVAATALNFEVDCDAKKLTKDEFDQYLELRKKRWSEGFKLVDGVFYQCSQKITVEHSSTALLLR